MRNLKLWGMLVVGLFAVFSLEGCTSTFKPDAKYADAKIAKGEASIEPLRSSKQFDEALDEYPIMTKSHQIEVITPGIYGAYGLEKVKNSAYSLVKSKNYRPQGLTLSNKYIFVSAYDHTKKLNSVIFVLDFEGNFVKTIGLNHKAHVGGIAYDGAHETLWISDTINGRAAISAIALADIENYQIDSLQPIENESDIYLDTTKEVSTLAISQDALWIGYFTQQAGAGRIQVVSVDWKKESDGTFVPDFSDQQFKKDAQGLIHVNSSLSFKAPDKIQGIALNEEYLYLTQSYGNKNSSLLRYSFKEEGQQLKLDNGRKATLPPYLEQVALDQSGNIYPIFESSAPALRQKTKFFVDRLVKISPSLFEKYSVDDDSVNGLEKLEVSNSSLN